MAVTKVHAVINSELRDKYKAYLLKKGLVLYKNIEHLVERQVREWEEADANANNKNSKKRSTILFE